MKPIPFLTTGEDPFARGRAHGQRFEQEIADNIATYLGRFAASGLDRSTAFAEAKHWLTAMRVQNPTYAARDARNRGRFAPERRGYRDA